MPKLFKKILIISAAIAEMLAIQNTIVNVSAQIDPIAFMEPDAQFGIVFPQERLEKEFSVVASQGYTSPIPYRLATQVKPKPGASSEYCLVNPTDYENCYPLLCPYLELLSSEQEGDVKDGAGLLPPEDDSDYWKVVLNTPAIKGYVGQDFEGTPVDSAGEYGCDVKLVLMGSGHDPIVKAKWEMNNATDSAGRYLGTDDGAAEGAQFEPSGQYQTAKEIAVCGIATDPDGTDDIDSVYAGIFYPAESDSGQEGRGCGGLMEEIQMPRLSKDEGIELFCQKIRNNNNNLPVFNAGFDYEEICGEEGELKKETTYVYCGEKNLSYEDPSGPYRTAVVAQDKYALTDALENYFEYLPLTSFETDFSRVAYGNAKLNTKKIIGGDSNFETEDKPTIRNTGNTRLNLGILQDDMGFGRAGNSDNWHVRYDSRVGQDAEFTEYDPETLATLNNPLNLSETDEMDFSVKVAKFKEGKDSYEGDMSLSAEYIPHLTCR